MSVGAKWKSAREAAGLSAQDAAELAELHRNTIYDLERDVDGVTLRVMKRVASVYGVSLGYVFRDETEPERVPTEFRPLLEPLRPFDQQDRERLIRNIAANLGFMGSVFAGLGPGYTSTHPQQSLRTDEAGDALPDVTKQEQRGRRTDVLGRRHDPTETTTRKKR